jgi:hypothetical protein
MKAIINGLRYDTAKAIFIGGAESDRSRTDFQWWEASLYRTPRSGRYFLAGRGGPMTRWATSTGTNSWTGGSGIKPLDEDDALEWAEQNLTTAEIEAGFAKTIEEA